MIVLKKPRAVNFRTSFGTQKYIIDEKQWISQSLSFNQANISE